MLIKYSASNQVGTNKIQPKNFDIDAKMENKNPKDKKYLISRSTNWYSYKELPEHAGQVNVIYYLANTEKRLLYIGKAEIFGNRVKHGRYHQDMPGDWNMFRYDIVRPEFSSLLERIEDHTIRSFASILKNTKSFSSLELSSYKLVNKNWKKS